MAGLGCSEDDHGQGSAEDPRGPWLFTLLDGKALEACEHVTLEDMQKEDGEKAIWDLLTARFPEKEAHDQMEPASWKPSRSAAARHRSTSRTRRGAG